MNRIKWTILFIFPAIFFSSCLSDKFIQRTMLGIQSELFYELTTPPYLYNIDNTIYLNPIDDSAMLPYSTIRKAGTRVIPLLLFNLIQNKYEVSLGESSLIQPYYGFLTDALLAECNRSSCFNLVESNNAVLPDSALTLEIKVNKNITTGKMIRNEGMLILPLIENQSFSTWEINPPVSKLEISARLMQEETCLWENTYTVQQDLSYKRSGIEEPFIAFETCIEHWTECLSYTTKGVVESISQNLHLLILQLFSKN